MFICMRKLNITRDKFMTCKVTARGTGLPEMQVQTFSPPLPAQVLPESIVLAIPLYRKSLYFASLQNSFNLPYLPQMALLCPTHIGYLSFSVSFQGFLHNGVLECKF